MKHIFYIFAFLPFIVCGQIRSDEAAFRIGNTYVGISKGGTPIKVITPPPIPDVVEDELYVTANALSRTNEADATTGLGVVGATILSIESSPSPQDGTSLIEVTATDQAADRMEVDLTLPSGVDYVIKYWAWESVTSSTYANSWIGFANPPFAAYTTTPTEYTHNLTTNSGAQKLRFYNEGAGKLYVDGLSIKQADATDPPPSGDVPEITLTTKYAFPGAFGAGRSVTGGRGGSYVAVTNLNNAGTGSFREALTSNSRIIIIKVEGRVDLSAELAITNRDNITIWGQFAPGRGLTISNGRITFEQSNNWIVRHMTFQNKNGDLERSAVAWREMTNSGLGHYIDHVSARYGHDQTLDLGHKHSSLASTVAYSLMGEGDPAHNTGSLHGDSGDGLTDTGDFTSSRNMYISNSHRAPGNFSGSDMDVEAYNNFVTNYKARLTRTNGGVDIDWFKNYTEYGNVGKTGGTPINKAGKTKGSNNINGFFTYTADNYVENWDETPSGLQTNLWVNYKDNTEGLDNEPIDAGHYVGTRQHSFGDPVDGIWDALDVKTKVLASVGHNRGINSDGTPGFFRDDRDQAYVTQATNGTTPSSYTVPGSWVNSSFTGEDLYADDDGDYMPDWFENQDFDQPTGGETGLNSASAADRDQVIVNWDFGDYTVVNNAGYTNLEMCAAYYAGDFETILDGTNDLNITIE